jgi:AcrR family transcriptional regulator
VVEEGGTALPRGPHNLPREKILASQRERLVAAILAEVGEHGYAATTVADVVGRAQVSRNAFYELFADKQDCFLAACDELTEQMLGGLRALAGEPTWVDAMRVAFDRFLDWFRAQPGLTAAYLVDLPTAGRRALEQRDRAVARFTEVFDELAARAREEQPELPPLPALATRMFVSSIYELFGQEIRAGRGERVGELRDPLLELAVRTIGDDATAARTAGR